MKTWLKGGLIGVGIPLIIFLLFWAAAANENYEIKQNYYEDFKLCQTCDIFDTDCLMQVCKENAIRDKNPESVCLHRLKLGEETFFDIVCGHGQQTKPNRIKVFFELETLREATLVPFFMNPLTLIILVLPIILGIIIGLIVQKIKSK